ncbi:MAG: OmpA family protein [Verrucomicrobia bacterium]|nr:OmpA family protein [Verrucomicrobiota bacterium]
MKRFFLSVAVALSTTSCTNTMAALWEDTKAGMYSLKTMATKTKSPIYTQEDFFADEERDFIPLNDKDVSTQLVDCAIPQPRDVPGAVGSKIPGIEAFRTPTKNELQIFSKLYFLTDQHVFKDKEGSAAIHRIANYLKKHPNVYIFIEGHADERASEAYNLALSTRRSNYVRHALIKSGVNKEQLYTASYGKERPDALGHGEKFWSKNRRVAFKLYEKKEPRTSA